MILLLFYFIIHSEKNSLLVRVVVHFIQCPVSDRNQWWLPTWKLKKMVSVVVLQFQEGILIRVHAGTLFWLTPHLFDPSCHPTTFPHSAAVSNG